MKNRLIALLLTLVLVLTVSVFAVSADETQTASTPVYASDLTVNGDTATGYCPHCDQDVTWTKWNGTSHQRSSSNGLSLHLFLAADVPNGGAFLLADKANGFIVLHLNGKTLTNTRGQDGPLQAFAATGTVAVLTNTAGEGGITCTGGAPINANNKGNLIIYGGNYSTTRTGVDGGVINSDVISNGGSVATTQKITIYGGSFTNANTQNNGGVFYMTQGSLTINGGTFNGKAANGGVIYNSGATVTVAGGSLTGTATSYGGAIYSSKAISLNGGTVTGSAARGGGAYMTGAALTVDGGTITGSTASDRGGSVCLVSGASLTMKSGTIENGCSWGNQMGGNIYAEGNVTISGGTITGGNTTGTANTPSVKGAASTIRGAGRGGNICIRGAYTLTMSGGTVSDGVSPSGGNLSIEGTKTNHSFSGGTISGGEALLGGNIYIAANTPGGTFSGTTVSDGIVYVTGTSNGRGGNLYNTLGTFNITGGSFTGGAIKGTKTGTNTGMGANIFTTKSMTITNATISGGNAENSFGGNLAINSTAATVTLGQGGVITNGTANRASGNSANGQGGNVMINNGTLAITGGTVSNTTNAANAQHAGNIYLPNANGTLTMTSGTISGGYASSYGGNIYAYTNSTVNITGGTISGGKAAQGGNVYVRATNKITLKDVTISGGTGHSIYLMDTAAGATLNGATVSGATAGAIYNVGTLTLTNTTISGNTAATAPGINNQAGATVTMTGGTISGNTATTGSYTAVAKGGNVYNLGTFNLVSGTIENGIVQNSYKRATGETATMLAMGGNIYNEGTFTMTTGTISGGEAKRSGTGDNNAAGGNVYNIGTFTMTDGTITLGRAQTTGGNVYVAGTADAAGTFTMEKGTISKGYSSNNQGGVRVEAYGTFTMNDGLLDDNDSYYAGGNIGATGTNAVIDINGGTISNGDSTNSAGGNILVLNGATVTVDNATISGGTSKTTGGNVEIEGGSATFTNCKILNGNATTNGGNIFVGLASGATLSKCEFNTCTITGGHAVIGGNIITNTAGAKFDDCRIEDGIAGTVTRDQETGAVIAPTADGRGGNIASNANTIFEECVIRNGQAWGNANPAGGNVYYYGGNNQQLISCDIRGGWAYGAGGNIVLHGTPTVYIKGDSYVQGGTSYHNWGGNIGYTNAAKLYLQGNTIIDGKDSYCWTGYQYGNNIGMSNANANVSHELHVEDNAAVVNGDHADNSGTSTVTRYSVCVAPAGNYTVNNVTNFATPKIYLSGNGSIDKIYLRGANGTQLDNIVVLKAGYTGAAQVMTGYATYNNNVVPGEDVYGAIIMDGYTGTGSVKVTNNSGTGFITYVDNAVLKIAGITGFKGYNMGTENEYIVESGFGSLDAVVDAGYDYAKLYMGGTFALSAKTDNFPIDLNNQVVTINTNGFKLHPIDWRTDGHVNAKYTQLTVDNDANIVLLTQNPLNGYRYLNVKGTHMVDEINAVDQGKNATGEETEKTFWTSNRIQVEMTKVSIKTAKDGIYYTTKIATNKNAAPFVKDYGTAVSLVEMPGADFMDVAEEKGILYTAFDLNQNAAFSIETRSALIAGILKEGEDNAARTALPIYANSFVTAIVNGQEIKIMAEETHQLSLDDVMDKLEAKIAELNHLDPVANAKTIETAVNFYKKWATETLWADLSTLKALAAQIAA